MDVAARFLDPVQHSHALMDAVIGLGIGIAVGVALVFAAPVVLGALGLGAAVAAGGGILAAAGITSVVTGLAALGGVIGMGVFGEKLGESHGAAQKASGSHDIADGAHTVFTGDNQAKQARMSDPLSCHPGQAVEQGSDSVFVVSWPAARKGDACDCGGKIQDGCATVLIGGGTCNRPGHTHDEIPWEFRWAMTGLDLLSTALGFLDGKSEIKVGEEVIGKFIFKRGTDLWLQGIGAGGKLYGLSGGPYAKQVALATSLGTGGAKSVMSASKATTAFAKATADGADKLTTATQGTKAALDGLKSVQGGYSTGSSAYNNWGVFGQGSGAPTH